MNKFLLPLGIFIVLVGFLAVGLNLNPREVPSPLIGKPAPDFNLPLLQNPDQNFTPKELQGKVWMLFLSVYDNDGRVGINYGVYGAPETYLIDKAGVIRFKQIGPITPDVLQKKIIPLVQELNK
jgi:cytochrome c biogenesis protein CcmG/thiol:disulfide interchange protein DsbE